MILLVPDNAALKSSSLSSIYPSLEKSRPFVSLLFLFIIFSLLFDLGIATKPSLAFFLSIARARELQDKLITIDCLIIQPATSPLSSSAQNFLYFLQRFWRLAEKMLHKHSFSFSSSPHLVNTLGGILLSWIAGESRLLRRHHPCSPIVERPDSNNVEELPEREPETEPFSTKMSCYTNVGKQATHLPCFLLLHSMAKYTWPVGCYE